LFGSVARQQPAARAFHDSQLDIVRHCIEAKHLKSAEDQKEHYWNSDRHFKRGRS